MSLLSKIWKKGSDFLGVKIPIICGAMTWISNYELVKTVSDNNGFPVLAGGNMPPYLFEKEVDRCIKNLKGPFAVNLITIAPNYRSQYEIILHKKVPFVIFAAALPKKNDIAAMKKNGKKIMTFASELSVAKRQIKTGVDALILEGSEAGGHIGNNSLIVLLQEILFDLRDFPVFVAGGIGRGEIMAYLLLMGAYGCQLGTRFIMSNECTAHNNFKELFLKARARHTVVTPQCSSKISIQTVRAIKNKAMDNFKEFQLKLLNEMNMGLKSKENIEHEIENYWAGALRDAVIKGDVEEGSLMAGQSVGLIKNIKPVKQIFEDLIDEIKRELERLNGKFFNKNCDEIKYIARLT